MGQAELELAFRGRHPAVARQARLFRYSHLPEHLRAVSEPFAACAVALLKQVPDDVPELTNALHRLWEAKNLAVVAAIPEA